jgi:nucleotide-binding universal stress UspA family protein
MKILVPVDGSPASIRAVKLGIDQVKAVAGGLTDFLCQRDGEIIAFARPDLAVAGTGLSSAAPVVDIRAMSAA